MRNVWANIAFLVALFVIAGAACGDQLVLFVQASSDHHADRDARSLIHAYETLASDLDVSFVVRDIGSEDGVPAEVRSTPALVFQNHRGRSVYAGRYQNLDRLGNFVRTARFLPQAGEPLVKTGLPVASRGRVRVATPLKVTALQGTVPDDFDSDRFGRDVIGQLASGMAGFDLQERAAIRRGDRMFYIDVHPYVDSAGFLFVSCAVFSQFNCHEPVYSGMDDPFIGAWDDRAAVFADVGRAMAEIVDEQISTSSIGDAFHVIDAAQPVAFWEVIGLALPEAPMSGVVTGTFDGVLPRRWSVAMTDESGGQMLFRFPPPLDSYSGRARRMNGALMLDEAGVVAEARFTVPVESLTMGDPGLDGTIYGADYLRADDHPEASFVLGSIEPIGPTAERGLTFGEQGQYIMRGDFTMRGISMPLEVATTLEPGLDRAGGVQLMLGAEWNIRLIEPFGMVGPDGPAPANDTVLFTVNVPLQPAADEQSDTNPDQTGAEE